MSISLYFDVHVRRAVAETLRLRGVEVLTAQADGAARLPDPQLLDRAMQLRRVLFTQARLLQSGSRLTMNSARMLGFSCM